MNYIKKCLRREELEAAIGEPKIEWVLHKSRCFRIVFPDGVTYPQALDYEFEQTVKLAKEFFPNDGMPSQFQVFTFWDHANNANVLHIKEFKIKIA